ncbi:MAG: tetratricopeptide repeat protein [Pirellulaceae bacterium]
MDSSRNLILIVSLLVVLALSGQTANGWQALGLQNSSEELYALAASFYSRQEWEQASQHFRELIENHPDDERAPEAAFYLGESLIQLNQPAEAEKVFSEFAERHTDSILATRIQFRLAECRYLNDDLAAAETGFREFMDSHNDDPLAEFALPYLGELYLRTGKHDDSRDAYQSALQRYPGSALADKCLLGLAQALQRSGQSNEAEQYYRQLADQTQNPLSAEARLLLAKSLASRNEWNAASEELQRLLANSPASSLAAEANYLIARNHMTETRWGESWQGFENLLAADLPDSLATRVALDASMVALRVNKLDRAELLVKQVKQTKPGSGMLEYACVIEIDIANRKKKLNRLQRLVNQFEKEFPDSIHLTRCIEPLARMHYDEKQFVEATRRYQQLVDLVTERVDLAGNLSAWRYLLGLAHIGTGDFTQAVAELESIDDFGANSEFEAANSFAIGTALSADGHYEPAIPRYQHYLELMPSGADAVRCQADLAVALARSDRLPEAIDTLGPVTERHAGDLSVLAACEVVAEAAMEAEDMDDARRFYKILAASDDPQLASRGANGLLWSGDEGSLDSDRVQSVIESGVDRDLACEAVMGQVQKLQSENQHQQCVEILTLMLAANPESKFAPEAQVRKAISLQRLGGKQNGLEAIGLFREYLETNSGHELYDLARYELGWALHDAEEPEKALIAFDIVADEIGDTPWRIDAIYRSAMLNKQLNNFAATRARLEQVVELAPTDELADYSRYALGEFATQDKDWPAAEQLFREVVDSSSATSLHNPARYWLAESMYQTGQVGLANTLFNEIRTVDFDDPQITSAIWLRLAQCAARKEDWSRVDLIVQKRRENPDNTTPAYQMDYLQGRVRMSEAKFDEARYLFSQVVTDGKATGTQTAAMSQWMMGESFFHQENFTDALRAYLLVDSLYDFPDWRSLALLQAAKCQLHMGESGNAITTCQRMLATFPDSTHADHATQLLGELQAAVSSQPKNLPATFQNK